MPNDPLEGEILPDERQLPTAPALPAELYLLPLPEKPFFPAQTLPLLMNEAPWLSTVEAIGETAHHMVGLVVVKPDNTDDVKRADFHSVGTVVRIHHPVRSDGKMQFIAEGSKRFRIVEWLSDTTPYKVRVDYPNEPGKPESEEIRAYSIAIINTIKELLPLNPLYSEELKFFLNRFGPNEPSQLTDFAASLTTASKQELQEVLEAFGLKKRMEKVLVLLKKELDVARLQSDIREKVDEEMHKLSLLETVSPEYTVTRNNLDWLSVLPWGVHTQDKIDLERARRILDRDHDGLEDVKDRIIEFLAVGAMKGEMAGSILLLIGPPGVGMTSIGKSVAEAQGRKFYRFSVGGMRDEAEIKGHRRTYIGAMPGKFVQALKEVGSANPVIMLDEIDKIGASYQGDPASALLEVLDPEQNADFLDHYLDVRFDLSKALFISTANDFSIPSALLDRMEVIRLSGYITEEKVAIAKHHLWPRVLERAGLKKNQLVISEGALRHVIEGFVREADVRNLEKQLGRVARKAVVKILGGTATPIKIGVKEIESYLDKPVFTKEMPLTGVGVVTGLAWSAMGGATLPVEASRIHTLNRGFKLTGKLGEVMKESAEIAYSYVASHLKAYGADSAFFDKSFVHLHVPEGATPQDGRSAGVTMATALLSLAKNKKIPRPLAMTGELTLTGQVLPVGGIREKVIAARRIGIHELILPEANRRDFDKLPGHIRAGMTVHFAKRYQDVVEAVFG